VPEDELKRGSPIPLYFQLQELLKEKIETGTWGIGEMIPSEPELCETYQVSRTVVRQALSVLEQDGQLRRVRGRGAFVRSPKIEQRVGGVSRLLANSSPDYQVVVLDHREERPLKRISEQLELRSGAKILRVMSLLRVGEAPVALFDSFFPLGAAEPLRKQLHGKSPFVLAPSAPTRAFEFTRTNVRIETSFCSPWEGEQLQIPVGGAVFVTLCTEFRREKGEVRPFEVVRGIYRVDRVQLRFDVASSGETPAALWQIADS
jgi:GntR family transcriptional regulator